MHNLQVMNEIDLFFFSLLSAWMWMDARRCGCVRVSDSCYSIPSIIRLKLRLLLHHYIIQLHSLL